MAELAFREEQKFRQPWMWCVVLIPTGIMVFVFGYGLIEQLILGRQWGNQPMSDTGLIVASFLTISFSVGMVWLFFLMTLTVDVRKDALYVHFKPLRRRTVQYSDIVNVEAVQYRPLAHYGGWGIRKGSKGWAYNVSGNTGVRLDLMDGTHLLLGSQRHVELAAAIAKKVRD